MDIHRSLASADHDRSATQGPGTPLSSSGADALEAALRDMTASFRSDSASVVAGKPRDAFEHRLRILQQMTATLARMRGRDAASVL